MSPLIDVAGVEQAPDAAARDQARQQIADAAAQADQLQAQQNEQRRQQAAQQAQIDSQQAQFAAHVQPQIDAMNSVIGQRQIDSQTFAQKAGTQIDAMGQTLSDRQAQSQQFAAHVAPQLGKLSSMFGQRQQDAQAFTQSAQNQIAQVMPQPSGQQPTPPPGMNVPVASATPYGPGNGGLLGAAGNAVASAAPTVLGALSHAGLPSMDPSLTGQAPGSPPNMSNQPAMQSYVPPSVWQQVQKVPGAGPVLSDVGQGVTNPVGLATIGLAPAGVTAGALAGSVAAGTVANVAGAPPLVRQGAEMLGGIAGSGIAGLAHAPEVPPIGETGIATAPASGGMPPEMQGVPMAGGATIPPDGPPSTGDIGAAGAAGNLAGSDAGVNAAGVPSRVGAGNVGDVAPQAATGGLPQTDAEALAGIAADQQTPLQTGLAKLQANLEAARGSNIETMAARAPEQAAKASAMQSAYDRVIASGGTVQDANAAQAAARGGVLTQGSGVATNFTEAEAAAIPQHLNDFYSGIENVHNATNADTAFTKLTTGAYVQPAEIKLLDAAVPGLGKIITDAQTAGKSGIDLLGGAYNASMLMKQAMLLGHVPHVLLESLTVGPTAGARGTLLAIQNGLKGSMGDAIAQGIADGNLAEPTIYRFAGTDSPLFARTYNAAIKQGLGEAAATQAATEATQITLGQSMDRFGGFRSLDPTVRGASEEAYGRVTLADIPIAGRVLGPIYKWSNRMFVSTDNTFGTQAVKAILSHEGALTPDGVIPLARIEAVVNYVNRLRFRGTIAGDFKVPGIVPGIGDMSLTGGQGFQANAITQAAEGLMWTPKMFVSPVQTALNLLHSDPFIRMQAAQSMAKMAAAGMAVMGLAKYGGALAGVPVSIGVAPNADFGKIVVGNTHINIWGPQQRMIRMAYQIGSGQDPAKLGVQYARSLLSPVASLAPDLITGKDYLGNAVSLKSAAGLQQLLQDHAPIAAKNIYDAWQTAWNNPTPGNLAATIPATVGGILGGRVETYPNPRGDLASAWNQKYPNSPFTGESAQIKMAQQDSTLGPLVQAWNDAGQSTAGGQQVIKNQAVGAQTEQNLSLPQLGAGVNQNVPGVGAKFAKAYSDYGQQMQGAFEMAYFGAPVKTPQSPEQVAYVAYRNVTPDQFTDPNTFVVDWNAYTAAKDAAKAALPNDLQVALANNLKMQDPAAQQAETRYQAAKTASQTYYNTPEYAGLTADESNAVTNALKYGAYVSTQLGTATPLSQRQLLGVMMQSPGLDASAAQTLATVVTNTHAAPYLKDPARTKILMDNPDVIYFGFVSPSSLNFQEKSQLPPYVLQGTTQVP